MVRFAVVGFPPELAGRWNHNTHFYPLALAATPCARALDVGCGDGLLLRLLAARCDEVVGVDPWSRPVDEANVTVIAEDFLAPDLDLEPHSFDLVCSFAAIHHMPFEPALQRMADLVAPGGRLAVVSLARETPASWPLGTMSVVAHKWMARQRGYWDHPAPVADPTLTLTQLRRVARDVVPGARLKLRLYWRWSLEWTRPR